MNIFGVPVWKLLGLGANVLALLLLAAWMRRGQIGRVVTIGGITLYLTSYSLAALLTGIGWWGLYLVGVIAERWVSYLDRQRLVEGRFLGSAGLCSVTRQESILARAGARLSKAPGVGYSLPISWETASAEFVHAGLQILIYLLFRLVWANP